MCISVHYHYIEMDYHCTVLTIKKCSFQTRFILDENTNSVILYFAIFNHCGSHDLIPAYISLKESFLRICFSSDNLRKQQEFDFPLIYRMISRKSREKYTMFAQWYTVIVPTGIYIMYVYTCISLDNNDTMLDISNNIHVYAVKALVFLS